MLLFIMLPYYNITHILLNLLHKIFFVVSSANTFQVPMERTCSDAYIEPHWCACLDWQEISLHDTLVDRAAGTFLDFINK
jgi:hypothetical protein